MLKVWMSLGGKAANVVTKERERAGKIYKQLYKKCP